MTSAALSRCRTSRYEDGSSIMYTSAVEREGGRDGVGEGSEDGRGGEHPGPPLLGTRAHGPACAPAPASPPGLTLLRRHHGDRKALQLAARQVLHVAVQHLR